MKRRTIGLHGWDSNFRISLRCQQIAFRSECKLPHQGGIDERKDDGDFLSRLKNSAYCESQSAQNPEPARLSARRNQTCEAFSQASKALSNQKWRQNLESFGVQNS